MTDPDQLFARTYRLSIGLTLLFLAACGGGGNPAEEAATKSYAQAAPLNWSDERTWGGMLPPPGTEVVIPAGKVVVLDASIGPIGPLRVEGTLRFADRELELTADSITITGTGALEVGTVANPRTQRATITLTGAPVSPNDGTSRGLRVLGGTLSMVAVSPMPAWTKLGADAAAGASSLQLKDSTNWRAGDEIVVAPTDHYGFVDTENLTLATAATGKTLTTSAALKKARWGRLQHMTASGLSLVPDPSYTPPVAPAPTVLDERAAVGNLSRRIVVQGVDDDAWRRQGHGAHVMVMDLASNVVIDGVEFRRAGQAGQLGRYPVHWHLLSYDVITGKERGDAVGHVLRNSTIWNSANRCVVLHATNGVTVQNNICYDILGHGFFLEDAVERRNVFNGNLALRMRSPKSKDLLKIHESELYQSGPAGFWITNPDNTLTNNHAGDAAGNGIWLSFPMTSIGLSRKVRLWPRYMPLGVVENNTAHTSRGPGFFLEMVPVDDPVDNPEATLGSVSPLKYAPMKGGNPCYDINGNPYEYCDTRQRFVIKRSNAFKNNDGGYRNRVSLPDYVEWTVADNVGMAFAGAADQGTIQRGLIIGKSLNYTSAAYPDGVPQPSGVATYHSTVALLGNSFVGLPFENGLTSGAFSTEDYYITPVERGTLRNETNRLVASDAGYRSLQPDLQGNHRPSENWALASALLDAEGHWGPKGWYTVPNAQFLTAGVKCVDAKPQGRNGKTCNSEYYGVMDMQTDVDTSRFTFSASIEVLRQDSSGAEIARWKIEDGYPYYLDKRVAKNYACDISITPPPGNYCSWKLGHMRHFATLKDGRYVLSFPNKAIPKWAAFNITNAGLASDRFLMAVSFDGRLTAAAYTAAGKQYERETGSFNPTWLKQSSVRVFKPVANLAAVSNSAGDAFWQDRANNLVWFRHVGGLPYPNEADLIPKSDDDLYRYYSAVVYPQDTCTGAPNLDACFARIKALGLP